MNRVIDVKLVSEEIPIGETTSNLLLIGKKGFPIPKIYLLENKTFRNHENKTDEIIEELKSELVQVIKPEKNYAILRIDDASREDFRTKAIQNQIRGLNSVMQRIIDLLKEQGEARMLRNETSNAPEPESAMLMMEMPSSGLSGLVFTKNPLNGASETVIELVSRKNKGEEIQSQQLIFRNGRLSKDSSCSPICDRKILERIVAESSNIEKVFRTPVSLEWGQDGENPIWLTVRPLHSIKGLNVYSSKIARDMLPGIILPLVWSINTPINGSAWKRLITQLIGENTIDIGKMTKQFLYRAYFNMGIFGDFFDLVGMPRETLEIMLLGEAHKGSRPKMKMNMRILRYMPRIGLFALRNLMIAKKISRFLRIQKQLVDSYDKDISDLNEKETMNAIAKIEDLSEECCYNVIVVRLARSFHHTVLRILLERKGIKTELEFDSEDLKDVEPECSLSALKETYDSLPQELKDSLERGEIAPQQINQGKFASRYQYFLQKFGHLSTSTIDMSKPQWRENPKFIINMIKNYQEIPELKHNRATRFPKSFSGMLLKGFYENFVHYEKYSRRISFLYAYGYALFRKYFLHLGNILRSKGCISENNDIFYLTKSEIQRVIDFPQSSFDCRAQVEQRKKDIAEYSDVVLPEIIYGDTPPPVIRKNLTPIRLRGLPSSKGYCEGLARVATTTEDYDKVMPGDVLIIPYSDASWTPMFTKAGAVISESGGLLSHCSIVAREYGIPAVVAVEGATKIPDNTRLIVDGYTGNILIAQ